MGIYGKSVETMVIYGKYMIYDKYIYIYVPNFLQFREPMKFPNAVKFKKGYNLNSDGCSASFSRGFQTDRAESTLPPVWRWGPQMGLESIDLLQDLKGQTLWNFAVSTDWFKGQLKSNHTVLSSTFFGGSLKQFRILMSRAIFPGMMSLQTIVMLKIFCKHCHDPSALPDGRDVGGRK